MTVGDGAVSDPRAAPGGLLRRVARRLSDSLSIQAYTLGLALLATSLFLNQAEFALNLSDLDMWDEAWWIASGSSVLEGVVPSVGNSPLVSAFYALASLPYINSPLWLVLTASLGRVILVCLLWLSAIRIARHLSPHAHAPILLGMFLVTPMATSLLRNPTDALYSALAGLALAEVLAYRSTQETRHAWGSSIFLGLAALARNDGLLLAVVLVPLLQILTPRAKRLSTPIASVLPVILLVGGVVLVHGLQTGSYSLGTLERTYGNFESGQQIVYIGTGARNATMESRLEARRLFGTPEENRYSVLGAIRRNPSEFLRRLKALLPTLPSLYLDAYGQRFGVLLLVLAVTGIMSLLRRNQMKLLMILAAFTLPILSGFVITLIRPGHLELWWFSLYALAAIGLHSMFESLRNDRALVVWSAVWGVIAVYGLVDEKLGFYYAATVMLGVIWIGSLIVRRHWLPSAAAFAAVALAGGLIIRGGFPPPTSRSLGEAADERAVLYLHDRLPPDTVVAAGTPGVPAAAGMTPLVLASEDVPVFQNSSDLLHWMRERGIQAVYVDDSLTRVESALWDLIEPEIGKGFVTGFEEGGDGVRVLLVASP